VYASILRSPHGHARIASIDTAAASSAPGVIRVFTGPDVAQIMPLPVIWVPQDVESHFPPHPSGIVPGSGLTVLATDRVRFAGDPVAVVVAETQRSPRSRPH
jgi:carbon-monoxide dehydrogenase large subunit